MNDLVKLVFAQIPKYISNFVNLLSSPQRFVRKKNRYSDQSLTEAITFLAITFVLGLILRTPLIPENANYWQYIATRGLIELMELILYTAALRFSWRFVGGYAPFARFLITFCYYYAIATILLDISQLFAYGVVKVWDIELYNILVRLFRRQEFSNPEFVAYMTQAVEAAQSGNFSKLLVVAGFHLMLLGGCVAVLVWMIAGWGAYRELTGLSKQRSMAAGVIFLLLGAVVITFLYFLNFALT